MATRLEAVRHSPASKDVSRTLLGSMTRKRLMETDKGMVRSDMSKPALIFFSLQEYTQQNTLSKF
jgi:hypothetical protein